MPRVELKSVTKKNYLKCLKLSVSENQKDFVATNTQSLAQAYVFENFKPYVAMVGEEMVGFLMLEYENKIGFVVRLMVDQEHQRKGYGREIMDLGIKILRADKNVKVIGTSHVPSNEHVAKLYASLGFVPWDDIANDIEDFEEDGELYLKLA